MQNRTATMGQSQVTGSRTQRIMTALISNEPTATEWQPLQCSPAPVSQAGNYSIEKFFNITVMSQQQASQVISVTDTSMNNIRTATSEYIDDLVMFPDYTE